MTITRTTRRIARGIGESPIRPDGIPKVQGRFEFSGDAGVDGMLWGVTLRTPHARARIVSIDTGPALAMAGVRAVLTIDDVPGRRTFGQDVDDQPVLADGETRFWGEPVAIIADATLPTMRVVETTLARAAADLAASGLEPPAILCIGRVALMRRALDWIGQMAGQPPRDLDPLGDAALDAG